MAAAMQCKKEIHFSTRKLVAELNASHKVRKNKYGCIVESHESTKQQVEPSLPKNHEDHIVGKGFTSMTHYNLVHNLFFFGTQVYSWATSDVNSGCKSSSGQGMEEARNDSILAVGQSYEQEGGLSRSTRRQKESPLCYIDGHLSSQKRGVRTQITDVSRGRVVLRGDVVNAVLTQQGSSASQMTAAKVMVLFQDYQIATD